MDRDIDPNELAADLEREANNRVNWDADTQSSPPLDVVVSNGFHGVLMKDEGTEIADGQYIHCENPVRSRQ